MYSIVLYCLNVPAIRYYLLAMPMQKTALSFTERSGHCGATSWHPLATSEGDKVIAYTVWREQESNSTSVDVTLLMSFCWCHSVDVHCEYHFVDVTLYRLISWFHFIDITLKISLVDVTLLMSLYWCHAINVNMLILTIRYVNEQQLLF